MEDYDANLEIQEEKKKETAQKTSIKQPQAVVDELETSVKNAGPTPTTEPPSAVQDNSTKFCVNCGSKIDKNAAICPKCGVAQSRTPAEKTTKFCTNCGSVIDIKAVVCPKCGVRQSGSMGFVGEKNPAIAALLSFLVVGLGQVYAGKPKRGIVLFAASVVFVIAGFLVVPILAALACWIGSIYDAYKIAEGEPGPFSFIDGYTNEV
ncbi:MAG: zinc ribbon domain-containing protein [Methanothrix sp.]|nr:zinc ribbon domain-containing protein [Methanothrix sp.]